MTTTARVTTAAAPRSALPRVMIMIPAGAAMLAGLDAALLLLGVPAPVRSTRLPEVHGILMVLGFVGTLVALERAVALGRRSGYLAPAGLAIGSLLLLTPLPIHVGQSVLVLGSAGMLANYVPLWRRQRDDAVLVQAVAVVPAIGATAMWLGGLGIPQLTPWLVGFLVLTICGERLELARIDMGPSAGPILLGLTSGVLVGTVASVLWPDVGYPLLGLAYAALTVWLASHDAARRTIRRAGLTRFMAVSMLAGYAWLLIAAGIWIVAGPTYDGTSYDAALHAVFLGFTISMVMAHAPVILPAVLRRPLPWHPALWGPLVLLHVSLLLRVLFGDAYGLEWGWQWGGVFNEVALLAFVAVAAWSTIRAGGGSRG